MRKRIVIKIGSSTLTHKTGLLNLKKIETIAKVLSDLSNAGNDIILVSSGSVAAGMGKMQLTTKPKKLAERQAMAAIGQCELMYIYDRFFSEYSKVVAQLLMTKRVVKIDELRNNARNTLNSLLKHNVIPIINENDSMATDELVFGDNDTLGALTAKLIDADLLIVLSDIDGLYDKNPNTDKSASLISEVKRINKKIEAMAEDTNTKVGTGGMITKINAAKIANNAGCDMVIANGKDINVLYDILSGKKVGTRFIGVKK